MNSDLMSGLCPWPQIPQLDFMLELLEFITNSSLKMHSSLINAPFFPHFLHFNHVLVLLGETSFIVVELLNQRCETGGT